MFLFIDKQGCFILSTTKDIDSVNDFLNSQAGMILYNSTCMCLQTIGETLKQIEKLTKQKFLTTCYPHIPWHSIMGLRNIISHEYATTDPEEIFNIIRYDLPDLIIQIKEIITDIESGKHNPVLKA